MPATSSASVGFNGTTYAFFTDRHGDDEIRMITSKQPGGLRNDTLYYGSNDEPIRSRGGPIAATVMDGRMHLYVVEDKRS